MNWHKDPDLHHEVEKIVNTLNLSYIDPGRIVVFRSLGSKSRAKARIWSFPRIWQQALNVSPHYCIEVLEEKFRKLSHDDQNRVLIHELLHIPKTFSGALVPHTRRGWTLVREAEILFQKYKRNNED